MPESHNPGLEDIKLGEYRLSLVNQGPRLAWDKESQSVQINQKTFSSVEAAQFAGLKFLSYRVGLSNQELSAELAQQLRNDEGLREMLSWQGLKQMSDTAENDLFSYWPEAHRTTRQECYQAMVYFAVHGQFPPDLSPEVEEAFKSIDDSLKRVNIRGSLEDAVLRLSSNRMPLREKQKIYYHAFAPHIQALSDKAAPSGQTSEFDYKPPQHSDLSGEKEVLDPKNIRTKIGPKGLFGYFRERRCQLDPKGANGIRRPSLTTHSWDIDPLAEGADIETRRPYQGIFQPGEENILPWSKKSLPLIETLQPANTFVIMRDTQGGVSITPKKGVKLTKPTPFSFDIVVVPSIDFDPNDVPNEQDSKAEGGDLPSNVEDFLETLSAAPVSDVLKGQRIARFVRQNLRYPDDEDEASYIDQLYQPLLENNIQSLWSTIFDTGVAHCYWANLLKNELCHCLGIAAAIMEGPFSTPDPRFDFSVIEAEGLEKHGWSIVWDEARELWIDDNQDATPSKQNQDEDSSGQSGDIGMPGSGSQNEDDQEGPEEMAEGDFASPDDIDQLTDEELESLYQEIETQAAQQETESREERLFREEKGVELTDWRTFEEEMKEFGQRYVAPEHSIDGRASTLELEDRKLTELVRLKRKIPVRHYRGPVRQRDGGVFLSEPVSAYVESRAGETDPIGWSKPAQRVREKVEVTQFEQDFIADRSGSMDNGSGEAQRQLILQSLYYDWRRNQALKQTRVRDEMTTPLEWRCQVHSFSGVPIEELNPDEELNEKQLLHLSEALRDTSGGSSVGLYQNLETYRSNLTASELAEIKAGKKIKVLTICTDGDIPDQANCKALIGDIRSLGIIVQGLGFGSQSRNIETVCQNESDPYSAVVVEDISQAPQARAHAVRNLSEKLL